MTNPITISRPKWLKILIGLYCAGTSFILIFFSLGSVMVLLKQVTMADLVNLSTLGVFALLGISGMAGFISFEFTKWQNQFLDKRSVILSYLALSFLILFIHLSLQVSSTNWMDNNSIRPQVNIGKKIYDQNQFVELASSDVESYNENYDFPEIAVHFKYGHLVFSEPGYKSAFFELSDGKLEGIPVSYGVGLCFIPDNVKLDTVEILKFPIRFVFRFKGKIYFLAGVHGGIMFELTREKGKFTFAEILHFDTTPQALAIYKDKILIAGGQGLTVIENFETVNIEVDKYSVLWSPNSIAVKNEDEVYVGMRNGAYSKLSLNSKQIQYFIYEPTEWEKKKMRGYF